MAHVRTVLKGPSGPSKPPTNAASTQPVAKPAALATSEKKTEDLGAVQRLVSSDGKVLCVRKQGKAPKAVVVQKISGSSEEVFIPSYMSGWSASDRKNRLSYLRWVNMWRRPLDREADACTLCGRRERVAVDDVIHNPHSRENGIHFFCRNCGEFLGCTI